MMAASQSKMVKADAQENTALLEDHFNLREGDFFHLKDKRSKGRFVKVQVLAIQRITFERDLADVKDFNAWIAHLVVARLRADGKIGAGRTVSLYTRQGHPVKSLFGEMEIRVEGKADPNLPVKRYF